MVKKRTDRTDYKLEFTKLDQCRTSIFAELLEKIDNDLMEANIPLHNTTLERIMDSVEEYLISKSKKLK